MLKHRARPKPSSWTRKDHPRFESLCWSESSGRSPVAAWRDGVVLAAISVLIGLWPLMMGHFAMSARGGHIVLDGAPARALGIAAIAIGACLHFHFFWAADDRDHDALTLRTTQN
jgi:hypothetical protein